MSTTALYDPPRVGGDTLAYCTKCKMELAHVIVAMLGPRPARVQCKTCKGTHNFKSGVKTLPPHKTGGVKKPKAETQTMRASEYWQKRLDEAKTEPKPFNVKATFAKGDVITHTSFGMGIVDEVRMNGKILVTFRVGEKLLVHGHGKEA